MPDNNLSTPADRYLIGGAGLPIEAPSHPFRFDEARSFQAAALDWIHTTTTDTPMATLAAPTGGGKTAVIASLASAMDQILCVYPTNALVNAQAEILDREWDLDVKLVTSDALSGAGEERSQRLLGPVQRGRHDVIVTNPDILQAILQGLYFSPGSRILGFYGLFDAAVFDEFHYYDPLAASGLLLQIKVLTERGTVLTPGDDGTELTPPRILLSSATPDSEFVTHVEEDLKLRSRTIKASLHPLDVVEAVSTPAPERDHIYEVSEPAPGATGTTLTHPDSTTLSEQTAEAVVEPAPDGVARFRYPMIINRRQGHIEDSFAEVATALRSVVTESEHVGQPRGAVIFNSAARSNRFQEYLAREHERLAEVTVKDNGYDTATDRNLPDSFAILNTTSKGEVGLNFDIQRLVMVTPWTATEFIQRIGRAARRSPAIVDLYGLDAPAWPAVQTYPAFLGRLLAHLGETETSRARLRNLAGLRAAQALQVRFDDDMHHSDEIRADFQDVPTQSQWRAFLTKLDAAVTSVNTDTITGPHLGKAAAQSLHAAAHARNGLDTLRGRSISHSVSYVRGAARERTTYTLERALQHYPIEEVLDDGTFRLGTDAPRGPVRAYYVGAPNGGDGIDLRAPDSHCETQLTNGYRSTIQAADLRRLDISADNLEVFFRLMPLLKALLPDQIDSSGFHLRCDTDAGRLTNIKPKQDT